MIEAHLRTKVQPLFNAVCSILPDTVTPNRLTLCASICGFAAGACIAYGQLYIGLILLWTSGICDILDGTKARQSGTQNPVGAYIDLISDRAVEAAVIIGFAVLYPQYHFAYLLFVVSVLLHFSTFLAASTIFANTGTKSIHYDHSLIERFEAFIGFSLMLILPAHINCILNSLTVLIFYSAASRFCKILSHAKRVMP